MERKTIVFAPHPDDETLGCGGTIAKRLHEKNDVLVVVMTDGRNSFAEILDTTSGPAPEEVKQIRMDEIKKAMTILGVSNENLVFFEFEDGKLSDSEIDAESKVVQILKKYLPSEVFFTYAKDNNSDHLATNRIVRRAIKSLNMHVAQYQYSIIRSHLRVGPLIDSFFNFFTHNQISIDISEFLNIKKAALNEYKTQTTLWLPTQKKPVLSKRVIDMHLKEKEIFYRI
jgi:LmbE family N-acetylglucosaminyl deacetylase